MKQRKKAAKLYDNQIVEQGPALYVNQLDDRKMRNGYFFSNHLHNELKANSRANSPLKNLDKYYETKNKKVAEMAGTQTPIDLNHLHLN